MYRRVGVSAWGNDAPFGGTDLAGDRNGDVLSKAATAAPVKGN
jgi:hypothetical protein